MTKTLEFNDLTIFWYQNGTGYWNPTLSQALSNVLFSQIDSVRVSGLCVSMSHTKVDLNRLCISSDHMVRYHHHSLENSMST